MQTHAYHSADSRAITVQVTPRLLARRLWPRAEWISGNGPFASVARCGGVVTVMLHPSRDLAEHARREIDECGCGVECLGRLGHEIVDLQIEAARRVGADRSRSTRG